MARLIGLRIYLLTSTCILSVTSLAPANHFGWEETHRDGSKVGRLYLKGDPIDEDVYTVDRHDHPVVVNADGFYVYASLQPRNNTDDKGEAKTYQSWHHPPFSGHDSPSRFYKKDLRERTRRKSQLWHPTEYRVTPDSIPPRHLLEEVLSSSFPDTSVYHPKDDIDFSCTGQKQSLWCPNNAPILTRSKQSAPRNTGTIRAVVILVKFSDHADREMPSSDDIDFLFNGHGNHTELAPTGTLQTFFELQSFGKFKVKGDVQDWIVAPYPEEYYSYDNFGLTAHFAKCAYGALDKMDQDGVDWSQYDQDGDGVLDSVVIFHSGYVAEGGGTDCINNRSHGDHRIWSHATSVLDGSDAWYSSDQSVRIGIYATTSAVRGVCGSEIQRIGIIGHEMLHMLGLPDLIGRPGAGVGIWDVMGNCWGPDGTLLYPATMSPWCRKLVGWVEPTRITQSGKYYIGTSQLYQEAYRIDVGFPDGEYLLIENRQKLFHDAILPGNGGLLIWHIDENNNSEWMAAPGWPEQEGWPGNGNHYQVALLASDGKFQAERDKNFGDENDFWINGTSLEPGPGTLVANPELEDGMYPNTDSYRDGIIEKTGIRISRISKPGLVMSFRVEIPDEIADENPEAPDAMRTPEPSLSSTTISPSASPTVVPKTPPTALSPETISPTASPTVVPTSPPIPFPPSVVPTSSPTPFPTFKTASPSFVTAEANQTVQPTMGLLYTPGVSFQGPVTNAPTDMPTFEPTIIFTDSPTTSIPTDNPTIQPTFVFTDSPTSQFRDDSFMDSSKIPMTYSGSSSRHQVAARVTSTMLFAALLIFIPI